MSEISHILGKAVRTRRHTLGFSQEELAFRSKLHRTYVAHLERGGRNPSLKSIAKLAKALKLPVSALLADIRFPSDSLQISPKDGTEHAWVSDHLVEILLVEDDLDDAEMAIRALKKCNVTNRIHVVHDGSDALNFMFCAGTYATRRMDLGPRVILLDLGLPKTDGLVVLRRIRRDPRTRTIPVIVLTASQREKDLEECRKLGVKDYIVKPVDFEQFSVAVPRLGLHWCLLAQPLTARPTP